MGISSARPDELATYPARTAPFVADLRSLADRGRRRLAAFVAGSGEIAVGLEPDEIGADIDGLAAETDHLAAWVASVGRAFRQAGSDIDGDGDLSAGDTALAKLVGEPTIRAATSAAEGRGAARELIGALRRRGIDPADVDAHDLIAIDAHQDGYQTLRALITRQAGRVAFDEDYAAAYYDLLGADGIRALLGTVDRMVALDGGDSDLSTTVADLATGWGRATTTVELAEEKAAMLNPDPDRWWHQHQLTLLLSGRGSTYDPDWLADAAEVSLVSRPGGNRYLGPQSHGLATGDRYDTSAWYPGVFGAEFPYADHDLAVPGLVALRALADNPAAANEFALRSPAHRAVLVRPDDHVDMPRIPETEELRQGLRTLAGDSLVGAFLQGAYASDVDREAQLTAYDDVMRLVDQGDVADVIKRDAARTLLPYLPEIGRVAGGPGGGERFQRPTYVGFVEELGFDGEATEILGAQLREYGDAVMVNNFAGGGFPGDDWGADRTHLQQILGASYRGLKETEQAREGANAALANGLKAGMGLVTGGATTIAALVGGPVGTTVTGLASVVVNTVVGFGAASIKNRDAVLGIPASYLTSEAIEGWKRTAVDTLVADGEIDPPGPGPAAANDALYDYLNKHPISEILQSGHVLGDRPAEAPW